MVERKTHLNHLVLEHFKLILVFLTAHMPFETSKVSQLSPQLLFML